MDAKVLRASNTRCVEEENAVSSKDEAKGGTKWGNMDDRVVSDEIDDKDTLGMGGDSRLDSVLPKSGLPINTNGTCLMRVQRKVLICAGDNAMWFEYLGEHVVDGLRVCKRNCQIKARRKAQMNQLAMAVQVEWRPPCTLR